MKKTLLLLFLSLFSIQRIAAQIVLTSAQAYHQNFNALPATGVGLWVNNSTLPGWYVQYQDVLRNSLNTTLPANNGSVTASGLYSLGREGETDRALGGFAAYANPLLYGLHLVNNTGAPIQSFTVSFTLEQWHLSSLGSEAFGFAFKTGSALTSLSSGNWQAVPALTVSSPATDTLGSRNGNLPANRVLVKATLYNVNLANGQEILFRWQDGQAGSSEDHGLGIDDVSITPVNLTHYYAKASGALNLLSTWGSQPDGSGTSPGSFTADNQLFHIHNNSSPVLSGDWEVSGQNSRVILGNNTTQVQLTINTYTFRGLVDVNNNATLTLANNQLPTLGTLAAGSTLVLQTTTDHALTATAFGNLTLAGAGNKALSGHSTISGTLTLQQGILSLGNYNLRIAAGGSITGGSAGSFILTQGTGMLERKVPASNTAVFFPVGNPTYSPAELSQPLTGTSDFFRTRVVKGFYSEYDAFNNPLGNARDEKVVNRTWIIKEEVAGGSRLTARLFWTAAEQLPGFEPSKSQVNHFHQGVWTSTKAGPSHKSAGLYFQSMKNISSFSPFTVSGPSGIAYYYSKSSGYLDELRTWGTNLDGSGTAPTSFTADGQFFLIRNNPNPTIKGHWSVTGIDSKIILTENINFDLGEQFTFRGLMDIKGGATLRLGYYQAQGKQPVLGQISSSSTVVFYTKTGHPLPTFTEEDNAFGNLILAGAGHKTISKPTTINGTLTLNSGNHLALGPYDLQIAQTGSMAGASSNGFIITNGTGALVQQVSNDSIPVFFPVGTLNQLNLPTFTPAALTQPLSGTSDFFRVRVLRGSYARYDSLDNPIGAPLTDLVVDRTWIVGEEVAGGSNLTLDTYWSEAEVLLGFSNEKVQLSHFDKGEWITTPVKAAKVDPSRWNMYTNSMSGIATFSPFINNNPGTVNDPITLPVELMSFTGARHHQQVRLSWATAMEKDTDYFGIETSQDGKHFHETGRVKAAGNSQVVQRYAFVHRSFANTTTYYRLKQMDQDKKYVYSPVLAVKGLPAAARNSQISVYPNPATGRFYLQGHADGSLQVKVCDLSGKQVLATQVLALTNGQALLDLSQQSPGVYLLTLEGPGLRQVCRLVKQ